MRWQRWVEAGKRTHPQRRSYPEREMIGLRQVLLELICYASYLSYQWSCRMVTLRRSTWPPATSSTTYSPGGTRA
jgi:hypothetical protein